VASDKDSGDNARLTYTMKAAQGSDDIFSVEPNTGVIYSDHSFRGNQDFSFYVSKFNLKLLPFLPIIIDILIIEELFDGSVCVCVCENKSLLRFIHLIDIPQITNVYN